MSPELKSRRRAVNDALFELLKSQNDQLLFLGLALTLSIYVKFREPDQFSAYAFRMSTSTAWFTCTVNMCIISIFQLKKFDPSFLWRAAVMILHVVLIIPLVFIASFPVFALEPSISVKCALNRLSSSSASQKAASILQSGIFVILFVAEYMRRLNDLVKLKNDEESIEADAATEESTSDLEDMQLRSDLISSAIGLRGSSLQTSSIFIGLLLEDITESVCWDFVWLTFYFTFGLTSLITSWAALPPLSQWSLSFGQLVPIFLLLFFLTPAYDKYKGTLPQPNQQM
ncbi:hypothetical protein BGZ63DRAFT_81469 [Mariannaea sp. PMI_226]|nr:hypothetical protein BGZ63DRAFT_81469 [Mariannaea sp. PMI_226]